MLPETAIAGSPVPFVVVVVEMQGSVVVAVVAVVKKCWRDGGRHLSSLSSSRNFLRRFEFDLVQRSSLAFDVSPGVAAAAVVVEAEPAFAAAAAVVAAAVVEICLEIEMTIDWKRMRRVGLEGESR